MSSPASTYVKGIHQRFTSYAAWPPTQSRRLGDVGRMVDGQFQLLSTLKRLEFDDFEERVGPKGTDLSHSSGSNVSIQLKAQGETMPGSSIPQAKAGALVEFSTAGAFVFQMAGPVVHEIEDQARLADHILKLYREVTDGKRAWQEDWCVITEVQTADKVTILVSSSGASKVELSADGIPAGQAPLATLGGSLSVVTQRGEVTTVLAESNLTPLFRVARVRRSVLDQVLGRDGSAEVRSRAPREGPAADTKEVLEPVPLAEALSASA